MRTSTHIVCTHADSGASALGLMVLAAAIGSVLADRSPTGVIDLLLLFGPLVVVPLALPLVAGRTPTRTAWAVLLSSALLVIAFRVDPSSVPAAALTIPWLAVTVALAAQAVGRWRRSARRDPGVLLRTLALVWLPIAAAHITLSRAGTTYAGIPPPLIELAGVHFTFAGFGATTLAACMVAATAGRRRAIATFAGAVLTLGSTTVGIGHLTVRSVEVAGTSLVTLGVLTLAALGWSAFPNDSAARILLRISGLAVLAPMGFALAYSWALATGSDHLPFETIAAVHGSLNALGFITCALLAWRSAQQPPERQLVHRLALDVWGRTILGGGLCGVVCLGVTSLLLTPFTFPTGAALGAVLGAPLGAIVAVLAGRSHAPSSSPARFTRALSWTGLVVALLACAPAFSFAIAWVLDSLGLGSTPDVDVRPLTSAAFALNFALGIGAVAWVGWRMGREAADAHLRRIAGPEVGPTEPSSTAPSPQGSMACRASMVSASAAALSSR